MNAHDIIAQAGAEMTDRTKRPLVTPEDPARDICPTCGLWTFKDGRNSLAGEAAGRERT